MLEEQKYPLWVEENEKEIERRKGEIKTDIEKENIETQPQNYYVSVNQ